MLAVAFEPRRSAKSKSPKSSMPRSVLPKIPKTSPTTCPCASSRGFPSRRSSFIFPDAMCVSTFTFVLTEPLDRTLTIDVTVAFLSLRPVFSSKKNPEISISEIPVQGMLSKL